jgi:hypothetical protein
VSFGFKGFGFCGFVWVLFVALSALCGVRVEDLSLRAFGC